MGETEDRIRLVLVDSQALFRSSLSRYLAAQPGLEVVGECGAAAEALETLKGSPVDVVLLDMDSLVADSGPHLIADVLRAGFRGHFLILVGALDARELARIVKLRVSGVFLKSEAPDRLVQAIRLVAMGAVWVDQKTIQLLADGLTERPQLAQARANGSLLTDREQSVLRGIVGGLSNRKIGEQIGYSESKVKSVVQQLFVRAGVRTRGQLVRKAMEGSLGDARALSHQEAPAPGAVRQVSDDLLQPAAAKMSAVPPPHG